MLNGPLTSPSSASCLRARTTASSTSAAVPIGVDTGRRERSRSPSSPSVWNRFLHL